jgi:hypothetical protein
MNGIPEVAELNTELDRSATFVIDEVERVIGVGLRYEISKGLRQLQWE